MPWFLITIVQWKVLPKTTKPETSLVLVAIRSGAHVTVMTTGPADADPLLEEVAVALLL